MGFSSSTGVLPDAKFLGRVGADTLSEAAWSYTYLLGTGM